MTDHKYIEQLLARYWQGETSLEEEQILRAFFSQQQLPAHLAPFAPLFAFCKDEATVSLSEDFDERLWPHPQPLSQGEGSPAEGEGTPVERMPHRPRPIRLAARLMPLLKAAAAVAIVLTIALAAEQALFPRATTLYSSSATEAVYVTTEQVNESLSGAQPDKDIQTAALTGDSLNAPLSNAPATAEWSE